MGTIAAEAAAVQDFEMNHGHAARAYKQQLRGDPQGESAPAAGDEPENYGAALRPGRGRGSAGGHRLRGLASRWARRNSA